MQHADQIASSHKTNLDSQQKSHLLIFFILIKPNRSQAVVEMFLFMVFSNIILTLLFQFVEAVGAFLWYAALLQLTTVGKGSVKTEKQNPERLKGNVLLLLMVGFAPAAVHF